MTTDRSTQAGQTAVIARNSHSPLAAARRRALLVTRTGVASSSCAVDTMSGSTSEPSPVRMNADGTRQRRIPDTRRSGSACVVARRNQYRVLCGAPGLWTIQWTERIACCSHELPRRERRSQKVAWSPDGTQVGFDSNRHDPAFNVYTIQSDGTRVRRMARVPSQYMVWSPDGRRIVFNRYKIIVSESVAGDVGGKFLGEFIAPASGGPGVRLLPPTNRYAPGGPFGPSVVSWSPDGSAIAVSGLRPEPRRPRSTSQTPTDWASRSSPAVTTRAGAPCRSPPARQLRSAQARPHRAFERSRSLPPLAIFTANDDAGTDSWHQIVTPTD